MLIHKNDQRNEPNSKTRWEKWIRPWERERRAGRRTTEDELSGRVNERYSDSDVSRHRLSGTERADKWCIKRTWKQRVIRGEHLRVCYLHLRHRASRTSKWGEQRQPQQACRPLMFSHHSDGHHEQLWCTLLWAFTVVFCYLTRFVCVRIWIFQNALGWCRDSSKAKALEFSTKKMTLQCREIGD